MPKINADNYEQVSSWHGSQDLFVVQQPDGTKVATAEQVKQFVNFGDAITGILAAGQTSITLDSDRITSDSWLDPYTSIYGVNPTSVLATAGHVTLSFRAQASDMVVGVRIVG